MPEHDRVRIVPPFTKGEAALIGIIHNLVPLPGTTVILPDNVLAKLELIKLKLAKVGTVYRSPRQDRPLGIYRVVVNNDLNKVLMVDETWAYNLTLVRIHLDAGVIRVNG